MSAESKPAPPTPAKDQQWAAPMDAGSDPSKNGAPVDDNMDVDRTRGPSEPVSNTSQVAGQKPGTIYREKQIKANKVYIGGLPESTRQEDLQACFGKIGHIVGIELKLGYGFVEFDSREAAEESVAEYHEGYFMGNKIRVELSHGGGRTAKFAGEPGACFKCGQHGHWARECPNHVVTVHSSNSKRGSTDPPLIDRISGSGGRDGPPPPPPPSKPDYRDGPPPYRDDGRGPAPDRRYDYYPPPPPRDLPPRDFRYSRERPASPPRDYRDYPAPPTRREYDDYRREYRGPPPPPPSRYDSRSYYPDYDRDAPYPPRSSYGGPASAPPPRDPYDRAYDKRAPPPPGDRYPPYPAAAGRSRSPVGPPRGGRDDYDRPPRDYVPPPPRSEYRGRGSPPPPARHNDYPVGYRRRSLSPPPSRSASNGHYRAPYPANGPPLSSGAEHTGSSYRPSDAPTSSGTYNPAGYSGHNGSGGRYSSPPPVGNGPSSSGPSPAPGRSAGGGAGAAGRSSRDDRDREYAPRPAERSRDAVESNGPSGGGSSYRRP